MTNNIKKSLPSLIIGAIGIVLLIINFSYLYGGPPGEYTTESGFKKIYSFIMSRSTILMMSLVTIGEFGFLIPLFLSPVGIFLAVSSLNSPQRKLAIFAVILNSINLIFALCIAWLLFGLARGM
jgi:hypothetical protein